MAKSERQRLHEALLNSVSGKVNPVQPVKRPGKPPKILIEGQPLTPGLLVTVKPYKKGAYDAVVDTFLDGKVYVKLLDRDKNPVVRGVSPLRLTIKKPT